MYVAFLDLKTYRVMSYTPSSYEAYFTDYAHMSNTIYLSPLSFPTHQHRTHFTSNYSHYYLNDRGALCFMPFAVPNDNTRPIIETKGDTGHVRPVKGAKTSL